MDKLIVFFRDSLAKVLIPVGVFLILFGVLTFTSSLGSQDYVQIEATVSKVVVDQEAYTDADGNYYEATYEVSLKYKVDGKEYKSSLSGVSKQKKGDKMKIYYNPKNPSEITQSKSLVIPLVILIAGIIAFIVGIIDGIKVIKKSNVVEYVKD